MTHSKVRRAGHIMRILVADDNSVFQAVLQSMLTQWGYDVVVASDGEEAWWRLQQEEGPRLAILDWASCSLGGSRRDGLGRRRRVLARDLCGALGRGRYVGCAHSDLFNTAARGIACRGDGFDARSMAREEGGVDSGLCEWTNAR